MQTRTTTMTADNPILIACARECARAAYDLRWGYGNTLDLTRVIWAAMPSAADSERENVLRGVVKALGRLGLIRMQRKHAVPVDRDVSAADLAAAIAAELRATKRYEATKTEITERFTAPALLGLSPERVEALWLSLSGEHIRTGYLAGIERVTLVA